MSIATAATVTPKLQAIIAKLQGKPKLSVIHAPADKKAAKTVLSNILVNSFEYDVIDVREIIKQIEE